MSYDTIRGMLSDPEELKFLNSLTSGNMKMPFLIENILMYINDNSTGLAPTKRLKLFRLAKEYFNTCFIAYIDQSAPNCRIEKLILGATSTVYYTTTNGIDRVATENEVNAGIAELRPVVTRNISEDEERHLNILMWTFNGLMRYYIKAGFKATYQENRLVESVYELIIQAGNELRALVDWMAVKGNYDKTIAILRASLKNSRNYKYPTYAPDEIQCSTSAKQIVYLCGTTIRGKGATNTQYEALGILRRHKRNPKSKLTPYDISILRQAYAEIQQGIVDPDDEQLDPMVENLCREIEKAFEDGIISTNEFALKVVSTIRQRISCSDKQLNILIEAKAKIAKKRADVSSVVAYDEPDGHGGRGTSSQKKDTGSSELMDMYDALGSGVLSI